MISVDSILQILSVASAMLSVYFSFKDKYDRAAYHAAWACIMFMAYKL